MNLALFASGNGTNVQAVIDSVKSGYLEANIRCLVCDEEEANVIKRVENEGIPILVLPLKGFPSKEEWEKEILSFLSQFTIDYVILAGFMRILSSDFLAAYPDRIINIHPSLLPDFPGRNGIEAAYQAGVKETGVTVFYVDDGIDTGKIIAQEKIDVHPAWSLEDLEEKIHEIEHSLYPKVIKGLE